MPDGHAARMLFVELIFRISTIKFRGISHFLMQNRHRLPQFFSLLSLHGLFLPEKSANGHFEARYEKLLAAHFAASQAVRHPQTKSYASGNDLFLFSVFCRMTKKTGNTSAEKLSGRTHPLLHDLYPLHRLLEDSSMKSYGEEKTHLNSTNGKCPTK
jgi:hypothetical protein